MRARLLTLPVTALTALVVLTAPGRATTCDPVTTCTASAGVSAGENYNWFPWHSDPAGSIRRYEFTAKEGSTTPAGWSHLGPATSWVVGAESHGTLRTIAPQTTAHGPAADIVTRWASGKSTGRFEIRFRSRSYRDGAAGLGDYRVQIELVPAGSVQPCPARSITVVAYDPAAPTTARIGVTRDGVDLGATLGITHPTLNASRAGWSQGGNIAISAWHWYAVEVAADHLSWFVDGKIVRRETRPAVLFHEPLELRATLLPEKTGTTAKMYTQMDWARWFSLRRTISTPAAVKALRTAPPLGVVPASVNPGCS